MERPGFAPDVVAAICRHMNDDHGADSLLICQTIGAMPTAVHAQAVDVDPSAVHFQVTQPDGSTATAMVAFATPALERAQVRVAVVELYERACAAAGLTPRRH
jgi:ribonuclease PH